MIRKYWKREIYFSMFPPDRPLCPLQVIIGLFQLPDVFVQLILDAARLAEVVLQHWDLLVALRVVLLQFVLNTGKEKRSTTLIDHESMSVRVRTRLITCQHRAAAMSAVTAASIKQPYNVTLTVQLRCLLHFLYSGLNVTILILTSYKYYFFFEFFFFCWTVAFWNVDFLSKNHFITYLNVVISSEISEQFLSLFHEK